MKIAKIAFILFFIQIHCTYATASVYKPTSKAWVLHHTPQNSNDGEYVLIGLKHSNKLQNPQLSDIKRIFNTFKPTLVLLEGGKWPIKKTTQEAIHCCGNMGFLTYLAHKNNIKISTWEGEAKQEAIFALQISSAKELKVFYALRQVPQILQGKNPIEKMNTLLSDKGFPENEYNLITPPYTISQLNDEISKITPTLTTWNQFSSEIFFEITSKQPSNKLSIIKKQVNTYRNKAAIKNIKSAIKNKEKVMILCGKQHFRTIMEAL